MTDTTIETIHYTADLVILHDDHVLLIQRRWDPYRDTWALPGGYVDAGETSWQAAVRELREETGIDVAINDLAKIGVYDAPGRDPRGRVVSTSHLVVLDDMPEVRAGDDAAAAQFVPLSELDDIELAFDHRKIINHALTARDKYNRLQRLATYEQRIGELDTQLDERTSDVAILRADLDQARSAITDLTSALEAQRSMAWHNATTSRRQIYLTGIVSRIVWGLAAATIAVTITIAALN